MALFLICLAPAMVEAARLTEQQQRGKQIYRQTVSPSGNQIKVFVGQAGIEAPGSAMACVNCHGPEARGEEGQGVVPTNITWEHLSRPNDGKQAKGRVHPPYTEQTFARAIREGLDPAGNKLDEFMPRYQISTADVHDLMAYLKVIASILDPGLSETSINLGTVLPAAGRLAEQGRAMRAMMEAYFTELNHSGGLHHRKIKLTVVQYHERPEDTVAAFEQLIDEEQTFAIVSGFTGGADSQIVSLVEQEEMPLIGPLTLFPEDINSLNRFTFYLLSGLREQARAQVVFAARKFTPLDMRAAVIYPEHETPAVMVEAIAQQGAAYPWHAFDQIPYGRDGFEAARLAADLNARQTQLIFFLGSWQELQQLLLAADDINWTPALFISGTKVDREVSNIPFRFNNQIFAAYSFLPSDQNPDGVRELERLVQKYNLSSQHKDAQMLAYCAAKVLVEGIRRAGRELSRERLVSALDELSEYSTGLTPPITFDPNRRIGALGAHILRIDLEKNKFVPVGNWISLAGAP